MGGQEWVGADKVLDDQALVFEFLLHRTDEQAEGGAHRQAAASNPANPLRTLAASVAESLPSSPRTRR